LQINDLNKIINYLLVGSLALAVLAVLWIDSLRAFAASRLATGIQMPAALAVLVGTLLGLSLAMFVGCVIDGFAEILFRSKMKQIVQIRAIRVLLRLSNQYEDHVVCREKFNSLWERSKKFATLSDDDRNSQQVFASALFFHTAQPGNVSWLVQHHAVHILATDYVFLILILLLGLPTLHAAGLWLGVDIKMLPLKWWPLVFVSLYPLCHLAIDRWLYTYEVAYRHGVLVLAEEA
jgi:hypothetical protein